MDTTITTAPKPGSGFFTSHTIPMDMLMDTLKLLMTNDLPYRIESLNEREDSLLVQVRYDKENKRHRQALFNLKNNLNTYTQYTSGTYNEPTGGEDEWDEWED
jgi:hypothetical protein